MFELSFLVAAEGANRRNEARVKARLERIAMECQERMNKLKERGESVISDMKDHQVLMDHWVLMGKKAALEHFANDTGKFIGDYLHASVILFDTMSRQAMHKETMEKRYG